MVRHFEVEVAAYVNEKKHYQIVVVRTYEPDPTFMDAIRWANIEAIRQFGSEWCVRKGCTIVFNFTHGVVKAEDYQEDLPD